MSDLISIIVPIYNTSEFLENCISSILMQSYSNIEVILVDDGSTDNSADICLRYSTSDERVKYIFKENGGLSSARNTGLAVATGKYISFVDSDDSIEVNFIQVLHRACGEFNCKIAMSGRYLNKDNSKIENFTLEMAKKWTTKEAIKKLLVWDKIDGSVCDKIFHHSLFKEKRFTLGRSSEDLPILTSILLETDFLVHVGLPLYNYFVRDGSITRSGFSVQRMSALISTNEVRAMVLTRFPEFFERANYYHLFHLIYLRRLLAGSETYFKEETIILNNELKKNINFILRSSFFSFRKKMIALLGVLNLLSYFPIRRSG